MSKVYEIVLQRYRDKKIWVCGKNSYVARMNKRIIIIYITYTNIYIKNSRDVRN